MALAILSRLFHLGRTTPRRRSLSARSRPRRPANAVLRFEVLEDRVTPSGGPGPSGGSGGGGPGPSGGSGGGGPGSSGPQAIVSTSGALVTGSSGKTYTLNSLVTALDQGGMTISQLFSGYPLAPNGGPSLSNNLVTLSDPSTVPYSMQNSNVALVPVLLVSGSTSGSGSQSSTSATLVLLDPGTGTTYSLAVNVTSAP